MVYYSELNKVFTQLKNQPLTLHIWRHPKPIGINGLCVGQMNVEVDPRKIKRLANQIQSYVKKNKLPKIIWVSPLYRSKQVGELLVTKGFECHVDSRLAECHFGSWEGLQWSQIAKSEIDEWCLDFANFAPDGGENIRQLFNRVNSWINEQIYRIGHEDCKISKFDNSVLVVGHAGWITAATIISEKQDIPQEARNWPKPIHYRELKVLNV